MVIGTHWTCRWLLTQFSLSSSHTYRNHGDCHFHFTLIKKSQMILAPCAAMRPLSHPAKSLSSGFAQLSCTAFHMASPYNPPILPMHP